MKRQRQVVGSTVVAVALALVSSAFADQYTGFLAGKSDLYGAGGWAPTDTMPTLSWTVTDTGEINAAGNILWEYDYIWKVMNKDISHILIEVTPNSSTADFDVTYTSEGVTYETFDTWGTQGTSNPGIPATLYGIKFEVNNVLFAQFTFLTDHAPVWGDFYSKDGNNEPMTYAYNLGFKPNDTDPLVPASNGSIDQHILRPDGPVKYLPDGGCTAALLGVGVLSLSFMARRKA